MQSNQSGECSLLCVFWFVCLAPPIQPFSPVYLSMANCVVSSEGCSSLGNITLLSHLICTPPSWFKIFFCTVPRLTWQLINEGSLRLYPLSYSTLLLCQKLFSCEGVSMATQEKAVLDRRWIEFFLEKEQKA